MKTRASIVLKLVVVVLVLWGLNAVNSGDGFMSASTLLFFTIQSNIWVGATCLLFAILQIVGLRTGRDHIRPWMYAMNYMFIVAITLTCMVMTLMLTPTMIMQDKFMGLFATSNLVPHYLVPIAAVTNYLLFDTDWRPKLRHWWLCLIPSAYYLVFALVLGANGVIFTEDKTYPYFFLDYESMGWFRGFQPDGPYGAFTLGVFWWMVILGVFILALGAGYLALQRRMQRARIAGVPWAYQLESSGPEKQLAQ